MDHDLIVKATIERLLEAPIGTWQLKDHLFKPDRYRFVCENDQAIPGYLATFHTYSSFWRNLRGIPPSHSLDIWKIDRPATGELQHRVISGCFDTHGPELIPLYERLRHGLFEKGDYTVRCHERTMQRLGRALDLSRKA